MFTRFTCFSSEVNAPFSSRIRFFFDNTKDGFASEIRPGAAASRAWFVLVGRHLFEGAGVVRVKGRGWGRVSAGARPHLLRRGNNGVA